MSDGRPSSLSPLELRVFRITFMHTLLWISLCRLQGLSMANDLCGSYIFWLINRQIIREISRSCELEYLISILGHNRPTMTYFYFYLNTLHLT